jgi:GNAT superfamily N-acetyltransferase
MRQSQNLPIDFRSGTLGDHAFVFSSWLKSYRKGAWGECHPLPERYFKLEHDVIERIMRNCEVMIACDPEDAEHLFGYIVFRRQADFITIDWVYVKKPFRKLGIAARLIEFAVKKNTVTEVSHLTESGEYITRKYGFIFNPNARFYI